MEYLKKAATGALLLLASPLGFAAVAVDDHAAIDVQQSNQVYFDPSRNDSVGDGFTGFTEEDLELIQGEGTVVFGDGAPGFEPAQGFTGIAEIRYTIEDNSGSDQGTVFVEVQSGAAAFQAVEDEFLIPENTGTAVQYDVMRNDRVAPGNDFPPELSGTSETSTQGGTVTIVPIDAPQDVVEYTPPSNFVGKDTFTYTLSNEQGESSQTRVTVYVGIEPGQILTPDNLTDEEARTFTVVKEACQQDDDDSLPCDEIVNLSPEDKKKLAQQVSGRHAKLQARSMRHRQKAQSRNISSRLREIRGERNQVSINGLNTTIMGESLPLGQALQGALRGGGAGDGQLISPWGAFINGKVSMGESEQTSNRPSYDQDGFDLTLGVDYRFSDTVVLGGATGFGESDTDFTSMPGGQDAQSYSLVTFGNYYPADNLYIDGLAMWTRGDLDINRRINVATIQQQLSSETDSQQWTAATSVGYEFNGQRWQTAVYGRLEYSDLKIDGYTENGGSLALNVGKQNTHSFTSTLGTKIGYAFSWSRGVIVPSIDLEYVKEANDSFNIRNEFADAVSAGQFTINAEEPDTEYMNLSTSASAVFSGGRSAFIRYETVLLQDSYDFSSYSVGFRTEF